MIFVTLGTQDKTFERVLIAIEKLIREGIIIGEVIVQAGHTKYESDCMQIFDFISMSEFDTYIEQCDVLITHGGVGSILNGIRQRKKVLAVARLQKYKEHENDHQVQIITEFVKRGLIVGCLDICELSENFKMLQAFKVKGYESNQAEFCQFIEMLIDK